MTETNFVNKDVDPLVEMETVLNKAAEHLPSEAFNKIIEAYEEVRQHQKAEKERREAFISLAAFQGDLPQIPNNGVASYKTRMGDTIEYKYPLFSDIAEAIKPAQKKHGLSYHFEQNVENMIVTVRCVVHFGSGYSYSCQISAPVDPSNKSVDKAIFGSITKLKRYTLCSAIGISTCDDQIAEQMDNQVQEQHQAAISQTQGKQYSDAEFNNKLQQWGKLVEMGKKTVDDVLQQLARLGVSLTDGQVNSIQSLGNLPTQSSSPQHVNTETGEVVNA